MKIQKDLDEVTDIMHRNIEEVIHRGETLDTLMVRSEDLSRGSIEFNRRAKKMNSCCG